MSSFQNNKQIIVIAGPTASGKTSLSVALAKHLSCAIISADSRQFYKELSIGTAKPTFEEMQGVPHYFVGFRSVDAPVSAGEFERLALKKIEELFLENDNIIIVGGSGMFIDALVYGTDQIPKDDSIREKWNKIFEEEGLERLQYELKHVDYDYFKAVDQKNPVRLIRALEVYDISGIPFSKWRKKKEKMPRYKTFYFVVNHSREVLYKRINQRVIKMMENGLLNEVKSNFQNRELQSLNTVGYKELFAYLEDACRIDEAISLIQRNTRRYAKRQMTWFRKNKDAIWLNARDETEMITTILNQV